MFAEKLKSFHILILPVNNSDHVNVRAEVSVHCCNILNWYLHTANTKMIFRAVVIIKEYSTCGWGG